MKQRKDINLKENEYVDIEAVEGPFELRLTITDYSGKVKKLKAIREGVLKIECVEIPRKQKG